MTRNQLLIAKWEKENRDAATAQAARGKVLMAALSAAAKRWNVTDPCIFITCGHCQEVAPAEAWTSREIGGELPPREFQCPNCNRSFRRRETPTLVHLDPIAARL